ncbi:MAG: 50S ribosomal protein L27 [Candidatus Magasanikbacteria bacterium]
MAEVKEKGGYEGSGDSKSKRLGVKLFDGESADPGNVIIKQRGTKYHPGLNVKKGGDDTLYAKEGGTVKFETKKKTNFDGSQKKVKVVNVV